MMRTNLDNMKQAVFEVFGVGTAVPLTVEETPAEALTTTAAPVPAAESAPAAPAAPANKEIADRDALVAVLSAAVAEELGVGVDAIRVVSLKQIN